jgi:predicted ATPase
LRDLFTSAVAGEPQLAVLVGEAGIGKSTLLKQLGPDIGIRAGAFLMGQCLESSVATPYGPWVDVIVAAHRAGLVPARPWKQLHRLVPELSTESQRANATDGSQRELLDELDTFLRTASTARPLMVMLDDMQWADPASWDALEFLLSRFSDQRLLLCTTIRLEDQTDVSTARLRRLSR